MRCPFVFTNQFNLFLEELLGKLACLADFAIRVFIAKFFILAVLYKLNDWDLTLSIYTNEYQVPFLPSEIAAYLITGFELIFAVFLAIGFMGRFAALALLLMNFIAVISYNFLWLDAGHDELMVHLYYGILLTVPLFHGPGILSVDAFLEECAEDELEQSKTDESAVVENNDTTN